MSSKLNNLQLILNDIEKMVRKNKSSSLTYNLSWFNLHYNRFLKTLEILVNETKNGSTLLEVGCSPGYLTLAVKKLGYKIYGIDFEPENIIESLASADIVIKKCDIERERIPFNDEMFDCVLFTEVLEHLNYFKVKHALSEIRRVLKKGGLLILSTPNLASLENRILLFVGKEIISLSHNRVYTLKEIKRLLEDQDFKTIKCIYSTVRDVITHAKPEKFISKEHVLIGFIKYPYWKNIGRALTLPIKLLIPSLRSCIFVVARK
jgi:2-polyprenyl-3-methyl-5-hydroxy-6-metoxy-1,4-benzoquinol methylase